MTKRLKPVSKKTAAENRKLGPERRHYAASRKCVLGGGQATDVHELIGGRFRQRTKLDPRYWLPVSRWKHDELQGMAKADQWVLKLIFDLENFSGDALSELPGSVTAPDEFIAALRKYFLTH